MPLDRDTGQVEVPVFSIGTSECADGIQVAPGDGHPRRGRFDREADDPSGQGRWQAASPFTFQLDTGTMR